MKIDRITYKEKFYTFQYLNCDIGMECSIDEGENILEAIKKLRDTCIEFHKQEFPNLYSNGKPITVEQVGGGEGEHSQKSNTIQAMISDMNQVTAIDERNNLGVQVGLLAYATTGLDSPEFREAYEKKLQSLQK